MTETTDRTGEGRSEAVATLGKSTLRWADLREIMIESAGADALSEWTMDKQLDLALREAKLSISDAEIDRERQRLLAQFSDDPDEATRILDRVRQERRLGPTRFRLLLRRNAGLRKLVADRVTVNDAMVEQLYQQRYGPRTVARLIMVESIADASRVSRRLAEGESFMDLAVELSIDESASRGGLLPEIAPGDATFPSAIRQALGELEPGGVSDPIAVDGGFAILLAERKIEPDAVALEDVEAELRQEVRLRNERIAMQQRARLLLEDAEITVLDTQLQRTWQQHRREILDQR
ncbi:MAG: peptidylprolyl isomerase [Phycisphaeraceae bacterium]